MTRVIYEEHLGGRCYLAEEFLSSEDLCAFKQDLELNEQQWRAYQEKLTAQ